MPTLTFGGFETESGYDYVNVREGAFITGALLVEPLHGAKTPAPISAAGQTMNVQVYSDGSSEGSGFVATLSCAVADDSPGVGGKLAQTLDKF